MGIIGAILGDIAGSKYEFHSFSKWKEKTNPVLWDGKRHTYTDDTVLSLARMDACLHDNSFKEKYKEYGKRYPNAGYGAAFYRWLDDPKGEPYGSWGNGSAMCVSFIGEYYRRWPGFYIDNLAKKSASVTHNHPEWIKGAIVTAHSYRDSEFGVISNRRLTKSIILISGSNSLIFP